MIRKTLTIALCIALIGAFVLPTTALARGGAGKKPTTITYMIWGGPERAKPYIDAFTKLYPETAEWLKVEVVSPGKHDGESYQALRLALARDELVLHFQPKVDVASNRVLGLEALVRWMHPVRGLVPPGDFIPLAEESGLIHALGDWVLKTAAAQCAAWRKAGMPLTISVNLSAKQFYREDLAQRISGIVRGEGCEPSWLELDTHQPAIHLATHPPHQLRSLQGTDHADDRRPADTLHLRQVIHRIISRTNPAWVSPCGCSACASMLAITSVAAR